MEVTIGQGHDVAWITKSPPLDLLAVKRKEGRLIQATLFEPFKSQKYNNNNNIEFLKWMTQT